MTFPRIKTNKGFTLIEIIVTITVAAILGTILVSFMGTNIIRSGNPVIMVREQNTLNQVMEKIIEEYRKEIKNNTMTLPALLSWINTNYSAYLDSSKYINFSDTNVENTVACVRGASANPNCYTLKIILKDADNNKIVGLFTE